MPVKNGETVLALSKEDGGYADDPILGVVENIDLGALSGPAEIYVGILAATILFIATNAGMIGVSRLTYSMGQYRQLPEGLRAAAPQVPDPLHRDHPVRRWSPASTILPGQADFLGTIYAFGAMLSFTIAHLAVVALRIKQPDAERPWRGPGNLRFRGYDLPLFAIFGGLGHGDRLRGRDRPQLRRRSSPGSIWLALGRRRPTLSIAVARDCRSRRRTRSCCPSPPWSTRWSTSPCSWPSRTATSPPRPLRPRLGWPRGAGGESTCW